MDTRDDIEAGLEQALVRESNAALASGALVAGCLGVGGAVAVPFTGLEGALAVPPAAFALTAATFCGVLWALARRERVRGPVAWGVMLLFTSLPTTFFVVAELVGPAGAAPYVHGPIVLVYFVCIAVSGTLFQARLSVASGVTAAAGYALSFAVSRPALLTLTAPEPALLTDLRDWPIAGIRMLTLVAVGGVIAGMATLARRLTLRVLSEQREKETVSRLFGEYVSEEVKTKLLSSPLAEAGERKEVVILFSDIRGFTRAAEGAEPEALVRRLNAYFDAMVEEISREGGVVDKFVGDAVMAVFGGVIALDDPEAAALRAAMRMRARLAVLREEWRSEEIPPFDNGIGLHAGEVLQGAIGARHRKDFTVIGDAVNLASRVEGLTKHGDYPVLITASVYVRLPPSLADHCVPLGSVTVQGRSAPLEIYGVA